MVYIHNCTYNTVQISISLATYLYYGVRRDKCVFERLVYVPCIYMHAR